MRFPVAIAVLLFASGCGSSAASGSVAESPATEEPSAPGEPAAEDDAVLVEDDREVADFRTRNLFLAPDETDARERVRASRGVAVEVRRRTDDEEQLVAPGSELRSGERFHMYVETEEDAYLYLMYRDPSGNTHLLLPTDPDGELRVRGGTRTRVPSGGTSIELDDNVGTEELYVICSRRPLGELDDDTSEVVRRARRGLDLPEYEPPPSRGPRTRRIRRRPRERAITLESVVPRMRMRGLRVVNDEGAVRATPDEDGVSVFLFPIEHVP